jgi:hypothetical protein
LRAKVHVKESFMPLSEREVAQIRKLIAVAESLKDFIGLKPASSPRRSGQEKRRPQNRQRTRRSGKELAEFRRMLMSERKKGVAVAELARKHGISTAYIYQLR